MIIGNREVNCPDILPQELPHTHLSLSCNSRVKIDVNVYNNTTRNDLNSRKLIQASSAHLTHIFEMVGHLLIKIRMVPESKIRKRHHWLIFKLPWRPVGKIQCSGLVFFFIITHEIMHERHFVSESITWLDVVALNVIEWRHRIKHQSQTTIILLANNIVAIIHLFKYNNYQISTFLLEPLAKIRIDHVIRRSDIKCCLSEWRHRIKHQSQTTIILLASNTVAIIHLFKYNKYPISTFLLEPLQRKTVAFLLSVSIFDCWKQ